MNMINGIKYGGLQNSSFNAPSAVGGLLSGAMSNAALADRNGAVAQAMNDATSQIASAVAQEMVAAVTQAAMPYTGQGNAFGQVTSQGGGIGGLGFAQQRAAQAEQQMRASILAPQLPSRSLMPIRRR
jgi:hypothetical protein